MKILVYFSRAWRICRQNFSREHLELRKNTCTYICLFIKLHGLFSYITICIWYFKYRNITELLTGDQDGSVGQSSKPEVQIDNAYLGRERRFIEDTQTSLVGHVKQFRELLKEMLKGFETFEAQWTQKLNDWLTKVAEVEEQRTKMSGQLLDFTRNI